MASATPLNPSPTKTRFFSSLGMKMLVLASTLLILSLGLCSLTILLMTRHMLQDDVTNMVERNSRFLSSISQGLIPNASPASKERLSQLAKDLLREPEIIAITIMDNRNRVIVQSAKPIAAKYAPFSIRVPVLVNHHPVGWIRAWY